MSFIVISFVLFCPDRCYLPLFMWLPLIRMTLDGDRMQDFSNVDALALGTACFPIPTNHTPSLPAPALHSSHTRMMGIDPSLSAAASAPLGKSGGRGHDDQVTSDSSLTLRARVLRTVIAPSCQSLTLPLAQRATLFLQTNKLAMHMPAYVRFISYCSVLLIQVCVFPCCLTVCGVSQNA